MSSSESEKRGSFWLPALLLLALSFAVRLLAARGRHGAATEADGALLARLREGDAITLWERWLRPWVERFPAGEELAVSARELLGDPDPAWVAVRWIVVVVGAIAAPVAGFAAHRLGGRRAGVVAGLLTAVAPLAWLGTVAAHEGPLLLLLGALGILGLALQSIPGAVLLGLAAAVAGAAFALPGFGLLVGLLAIGGPGRLPRIGAGLVAFAAALFLLPEFGSFTPPGAVAGAAVASPLATALEILHRHLGWLGWLLLAVGGAGLARGQRDIGPAVALSAGGALLLPLLGDDFRAVGVAATIPGAAVLAGVGVASVPFGRILAVLLLLFPGYQAATELLDGWLAPPAEQASQWLQRHLPNGGVFLVEPETEVRVPTVDGVEFARALVDEGYLTTAQGDAYVPLGKALQPHLLPPANADSTEAPFFYDPNLLQFVPFLVLGDPPARPPRGTPLSEAEGQLFTTRRVFHEYFRANWETAARLESRWSTGAPVTILRRPAEFELDPDQLQDVAGILDTGFAAELRANSPVYPAWVRELGTAFRTLGDVVNARRFLGLARRLDTQDAEAYYQYALQELQRYESEDGTPTNLERAKEELLISLGLDSENAGAHYNLGRVLELEGDLNGAANQYRYAAMNLLDPRPALSSLSFVLYSLGRTDEALEVFGTLEELAPDGEDTKALRRVLQAP